ncbi:MAG: winged helix-turn-helix transcriptional regulator [Candidatus Abawacabacteria bacterium]|nr:winged helix-turn-helix transcriptional regulator [Candidatus Abawacabacteria bacterium]
MPSCTPKKCSQCFALLADETRLKIFSKVRAGINQVKLLEKELAVSQPTISHHLAMLSSAGVVIASKQGRETKYQYNPQFACNGCNIFNLEFRV